MRDKKLTIWKLYRLSLKLTPTSKQTTRRYESHAYTAEYNKQLVLYRMIKKCAGIPPASIKPTTRSNSTCWPFQLSWQLCEIITYTICVRKIYARRYRRVPTSFKMALLSLLCRHRHIISGMHARTSSAADAVVLATAASQPEYWSILLLHVLFSVTYLI